MSVTENALDSYLSASASDSYGGLINSGGQITVFLLPGAQSSASDTIATVLASIPAGEALQADEIHVASATTSIATLRNETAALDSDQDTLANEGVRLVQYGPDVPDNTLFVQVDSSVPDPAAIVEKAVGSSNVKLVNSPGYAVAASTREADSNPWKGGDAIYNSIGNCTSGYPVADSSGVT
jgi:streptogrisin B